jgi:hypothetical protein
MFNVFSKSRIKSTTPITCLDAPKLMYQLGFPLSMLIEINATFKKIAIDFGVCSFS